MMLSKSVFSRKMSIISATKRGPRFISSPSVHTSFPATMYRFQLRRESSLFHNKIKNGGFFRDGVEIADDGLVYLRLSSTQNFSNGPIFRPNTCLMQELLRSDYDLCEEQAEMSGDIVHPIVVCIKKGTTIPTSLQLFQERISRFSLQPSHPMTLRDLNDTLCEFYSNHALITDAVEWMECNEFHNAYADNATEDWLQY